MKVGVDCRLINKIQNTGISRYTEFLIEYYISRFEAKNIILITNDKTFEYKGCIVLCTDLKPFNVIHFSRFSKFVDRIGMDLLHVPFYSGFFRKSVNTKIIVTVHDLMYRFVAGFFGSNKILNYLKVKYFNFIVKTSLVNSDKIVSVSETTKNDVNTIFGLSSIHIAEDSEIAGKMDYSILEKNNLSNKGFFFYCGNSRPHKNIDFIIDVFSNNAHLPVLVLAGKGHQNHKNVIALGIVSDQELKALYSSAIAFVFPSKYEGFGLPVLEAIRSETFVIASKIPAFLEFKSDNIFFFELNDNEEFLTAIEKASTREFVVDKSFLYNYDKEKIYGLTDSMINDFLK